MFSVVYIDIHNSKTDFASFNVYWIVSAKAQSEHRVVISLSLYGYEFWIFIFRKDFISSDVSILSANIQSPHSFGQSCYITALELFIPVSQQQISSKSYKEPQFQDFFFSRKFLPLHLLLLIHRLQKESKSTAELFKRTRSWPITTNESSLEQATSWRISCKQVLWVWQQYCR